MVAQKHQFILLLAGKFTFSLSNYIWYFSIKLNLINLSKLQYTSPWREKLLSHILFPILHYGVSQKHWCILPWRENTVCALVFIKMIYTVNVQVFFFAYFIFKIVTTIDFTVVISCRITFETGTAGRCSK